MVLTGRTGALAAAGSAVVGVVSGVFHVPGWAGITVFEAALACGVAADAINAASLRDLVFHRGGDSTVRLTETATVQLAVTNTGARTLHGTLRDAWTPSAGNTRQRQPGEPPLQAAELPKEPRHALSVGPNATQQIASILRPTRRGDRVPDRVTVRSLGPLGLAGRQMSRQVPWRVRVLPPFESRKHLPSRLARLHETDGRTPVLVRGQGSEFDSLREYVVGDDVRSIDWRATARRNDVVVRTWRPERDRRVVIVVDTSRTSAGRVGDMPRLDSAIDAALLLAALATRAGDRVDLMAYDQRLQASVAGAVPGKTLALFSDAMAGLEPSLIELDAEGLVAQLTKRVRRQSLVVLLTSIDAAAIEQGLLPQMDRLTQRHNVIVASVADPRIAELAHARGNADAVFAAASAELSLSARRRVAADLSRHRAHVVDAVPERFAPALADAYLALKAAGRL
ncbi:MAG: DUF58 domain-containing protein [Actinocrinis sp.]